MGSPGRTRSSVSRRRQCASAESSIGRGVAFAASSASDNPETSIMADCHSGVGPVVFVPPSTDTYSQYSSALFADRQVSMYYRNITAVVGSGDVGELPEPALARVDVA